jgi:hypothetical protein
MPQNGTNKKHGSAKTWGKSNCSHTILCIYVNAEIPNLKKTYIKRINFELK